MTAYSVPTAMTGETGIEGFGTVPFSFDAGVVEPADDREAAVLAQLAQNGLVEPATAKKAAKPGKTDPTPEKE